MKKMIWLIILIFLAGLVGGCASSHQKDLRPTESYKQKSTEKKVVVQVDNSTVTGTYASLALEGDATLKVNGNTISSSCVVVKTDNARISGKEEARTDPGIFNLKQVEVEGGNATLSFDDTVVSVEKFTGRAKTGILNLQTKTEKSIKTKGDVSDSGKLTPEQQEILQESTGQKFETYEEIIKKNKEIEEYNRRIEEEYQGYMK